MWILSRERGVDLVAPDGVALPRGAIRRGQVGNNKASASWVSILCSPLAVKAQESSPYLLVIPKIHFSETF